MKKLLIPILALALCPPAIAAAENQPSMSQGCYVDVAEIVELITAYLPAIENYHKAKDHYNRQAKAQSRIDLSGEGRVEVKCE